MSLDSFDGKHMTGVLQPVVDQRFKHWIPRGITSICKLIKNVNFMSFQQIKHKYELSNQEHFRYLEIRDFYDKEIKQPVKGND